VPIRCLPASTAKTRKTTATNGAAVARIRSRAADVPVAMQVANLPEEQEGRDHEPDCRHANDSVRGRERETDEQHAGTQHSQGLRPRSEAPDADAPSQTSRGTSVVKPPSAPPRPPVF